MIIVKLKGGLGNQFFQYALGRQLAEIHKRMVKLDISSFETYNLHMYSIWPFNIQEKIASAVEIAALTTRKTGIVERTATRLLRRPPRRAATYVQEKYFHFDPDILKLHSSVYLDGYWQSEKYFTDIAEILCQEFTVKTPQVGKDKDLAERIISCESVSLHIRRGSYLRRPYNALLSPCALDYYLRSAEYIARKVRNPHFFVFSDDPEWARDNLKLSHPMTFVDHNGADRDYEDLRLMSMCQHHIIANSTFSWWGAWLCANAGKIVIAPRKWFNDTTRNTKDLIPETWMRL